MDEWMGEYGSTGERMLTGDRQDRKCTYNLTLRRVLANTVAEGKQ
jgi:hypothetical protein